MYEILFALEKYSTYLLYFHIVFIFLYIRSTIYRKKAENKYRKSYEYMTRKLAMNDAGG